MSPGRPRPAVSVVIPAFNRRRLLSETLASVRAQSFADYEVVLVDDGSTDGTAGWVRRAFPEVRVVRLARNQGPAAARNRGIEEARAPLIAFLDSDDLWRADFLRTLSAEFRNPRVVMAFSNVDRVDARGRVTGRRIMRLRPSGFWGLPLTSASIVRRSALAAAGGFDPRFRQVYEDADLFARLGSRHGPAAFRMVDRALVCYRVHKVQLTAGLKSMFWARARTRRAATPVERCALLDLASLRLKHHRPEASASRTRSGPKVLAQSACEIFEVSLSQYKDEAGRGASR
jgi:glycosyltransferase involved in cell wall biosynthesis